MVNVCHEPHDARIKTELQCAFWPCPVCHARNSTPIGTVIAKVSAVQSHLTSGHDVLEAGILRLVELGQHLQDGTSACHLRTENRKHGTSYLPPTSSTPFYSYPLRFQSLTARWGRTGSCLFGFLPLPGRYKLVPWAFPGILAVDAA